MALKPRTRKPSRQDGPPDDPVAASADPALLAAAQRARKMLHRRALTAAAASVVPVPGLDWAVDAALLSRLLRLVDTRLPRVGLAHWSAPLTEREREVAQLAAIGDSNLTIADALGITERTVKAHLKAVFEKLQVADRLQLALRVHGVR